MLTPTETLDNLRDSIINAALKYQDGDVEIRFATTKQVQTINIVLGKIVPETKAAKGRALRIALLAEITGRDPRFFRSSKDLTLEEATALIDRIYDTDTTAVYTWDERRPHDGDQIQAWSEPMRLWISGVYFNDGVDGLIEWDDASVCEIEEYGKDTITKWRALSSDNIAFAAMRPETVSAIQCAYANVKERQHVQSNQVVA